MSETIFEKFRHADIAYVSAILHNGSPAAVHVVASEDIGDPLARLIHESAVALLDDNKPVDPHTVSLHRVAERGSDWTRQVIDVYTREGIVSSNWATYAVGVKEGARRRAAIRCAEHIIQAANSSTEKVLNEALLAAALVVAK